MKLVPAKARGLEKFLGTLCSQWVSDMATMMAYFALSTWMYQQTRSALHLSMLACAGALPRVILLPVAGVCTDRWDKKLTLVLGDVFSSLPLLLLAVAISRDAVQMHHCYIAVFLSSAAAAFQMPAQAAIVPLLVEKDRLGQASGWMSMAQSAAIVVAPLMGGFLLGHVRLAGVLFLEFFFMLLANGILMAVPLPKRAPAPATNQRRTLFADAWHGIAHLREHRDLVKLLHYSVLFNMFFGMSFVLTTALVLNFSSVQKLGLANGFVALGMLLTGLWLSTSGCPRNRATSIRLANAGVGVSFVAIALSRNICAFALLAMAGYALQTFLANCIQVTWQEKISSEFMGRAMALKMMFSLIAVPVSRLLAGPLADGLGTLANRISTGIVRSIIEGTVGCQAGNGAALAFGLCGFAILIVGEMLLARTSLTPVMESQA